MQIKARPSTGTLHFRMISESKQLGNIIREKQNSESVHFHISFTTKFTL